MHSGKAVFVPLEKELKQVENYIALEMLRYEDRVRVEVHVAGETDHHVIGPMILITLIENAFKHGVMKSTRASWIEMKLKCDEHHVNVTITNSAENHVNGKGIGLDNLRSQLNYLYAGKHEMKVRNEVPDEFSINLSLTK
jgi:LytS/YehU family sensor histidine kinase